MTWLQLCLVVSCDSNRCVAWPLSPPANHSRNCNPYVLCSFLFLPVPHFSSLPRAELPLSDELICSQVPHSHTRFLLPRLSCTCSIDLLVSPHTPHFLSRSHRPRCNRKGTGCVGATLYHKMARVRSLDSKRRENSS